MKVGLFAAAARLGDVDANIAQVAEAAAATDADLVVFPELHLTGYNIGDDVQRLAFHDDDERLEPLHRAAGQGAAIIAGAPRRSRAGIYHNSMGLFTADGVQWYDKRCLATFTTFREGLFFQPGKESPVWETPWGNIGPAICYDAYFPELQRDQALAGADVLINISASPATTRPFFETVLPARAVENACFQLYSNVVGAQDGVVFWGGSHGIGPRGQYLGGVEPHEDGVKTLTLNLDDLEAARQFRPTLRDAPRLHDEAWA